MSLGLKFNGKRAERERRKDLNYRLSRELFAVVRQYHNPSNWTVKDGMPVWIGDGNGPELADEVINKISEGKV